MVSSAQCISLWPIAVVSKFKAVYACLTSTVEPLNRGHIGTV